MIDVQNFEGLLEALDREIEELPEGSVKENLTDIGSALYSIFEDVAFDDLDRIIEENKVFRQLLTAYLSHEDKLYIRFKYEIEL